VAPATAVAVTAPAKIAYVTNVSERSVVTGDVLRVYVRTNPVKPKVVVRLYSRPRPTAAWAFRVQAPTPVSGRLTFSLPPTTTDTSSNCYNRSVSQSWWAGLVDAFWAYGVDKCLDGAADAAWGPVVDALLSKARLTAIGLDQAAKNLFNSWILQDVQRVLDNS